MDREGTSIAGIPGPRIVTAETDVVAGLAADHIVRSLARDISARGIAHRATMKEGTPMEPMTKPWIEPMSAPRTSPTSTTTIHAEGCPRPRPRVSGIHPVCIVPMNMPTKTTTDPTGP
ncbi:MAG TPA: hypothetical protein VIF84_07110 [Candidatus Limnocylindrales bacterium]|jgi:hypothetical protein